MSRMSHEKEEFVFGSQHGQVIPYSKQVTSVFSFSDLTDIFSYFYV